MNQSIVRIASILLISLGIIAGAGFSVLTAWAGYEASLFAPSVPTEGRLPGLRCPYALAEGEAATVAVEFTNPTGRRMRRPIRAYISDGFVTLIREERTILDLAAGEERRLAWRIAADDAAWDRFVLVRVEALRSAPLPSQSATCGIPLLTLFGLTGNQTVTLIVAVSLLSMGIGWGLWWLGNSATSGRASRGMVALAGLCLALLASMIANLLDAWLVAGLFLLLAALLAIALTIWIFDTYLPSG